MKTLKAYSRASSFLLVIFLAGCKKDLNNKRAPDPLTQEVTAFKDLKVDGSFNWKNDREVELQTIPLNLPVEIFNNLKIYSTDRSQLYFNAHLSMNQEFKSKVLIPNHVQEVLVTYGTIAKKVAVTGNQIRFDFITVEN